MSFDSQTQEEYFKNTDVNGCQYTMTRFAPTPALKLSTRLAKFVGPAIAEAVASFQAAGKTPTVKDLNMAKIVLAILPEVDEDKVSTTIKDIISCCSFAGVELKGNAYEEHFRGSKMKNLLPLVGKVVEYQFADFLSGLLTAKRP